MLRTIQPLIYHPTIFKSINPITCVRRASYQGRQGQEHMVASELVALLSRGPDKTIKRPKAKGNMRRAKSYSKSNKIVDPTKPIPVLDRNTGVTRLMLLNKETPFDRASLVRRPGAKKRRRPKNMMTVLKHFEYYPKRIQQWVSYARMPKGRYNAMGYWKVDNRLAHQELAKREELAEVGRRRQMDKEVVAEREQMIANNPLPPDLVGKYRFGVQPEETVDLNPKFREWLTFRHANNSEINQYRRQQAMLKWQSKPYDTGTPGVQIAVLTEKINYLTAHITKHRGDEKTRFGLRALINKRYRLMKYTKRKNVPLYYDLVTQLNIKDMG